MTPASIHQVLAGFASGDAISHEALALRALCRDAGFASEIYAPADRIAPDRQHDCHPLNDYSQQAGDIVIGHYSIASAATGVFLDSPARKILIYHNITPPEFFAPFDSAVARQLSDARRELSSLLGRVDAVWADSAFNAAELKALGATGATVFPLLFDSTDLNVPPDPAVLAKFAVPMKNILFVGRIAPNKAIEELITAFAWFHRNIEPQSRLLIVGSDRSAPSYYAMLKMLAAELELDTVCFERFASPAGLATYYGIADAFVTTSRHEGYCLPLLEAMHKNVPVIARQTGGTPEAMGGAGILVDDFSPQELAELLGMICHDTSLRQTVLASQARRLEEVRNRPVKDEFLALLAGVLPSSQEMLCDQAEARMAASENDLKGGRISRGTVAQLMTEALRSN